MDETLYIVVKRLEGKPWRGDEIFSERRLAENYIECRTHIDDYPKWKFGIVEGPVVSPADMAEQEATLGEF